MKQLLAGFVVLLALAGAVALAAVAGVVRDGFSARATPSSLEAGLAELVQETARGASGARDRRSPLIATPDVVARGRRHFAQECAACHGNDGKGSALGRGMSPAVPDLATSTRDLTEGEIFHVIEEGIRFSGMPAFGRPGDAARAEDHWAVVAFIRHLPELLEQEREEMAAENPRSYAEWQAWKDAGGVLPAPEPGGHAGHAHGAHGGHGAGPGGAPAPSTGSANTGPAAPAPAGPAHRH